MISSFKIALIKHGQPFANCGNPATFILVTSHLIEKFIVEIDFLKNTLQNYLNYIIVLQTLKTIL